MKLAEYLEKSGLSINQFAIKCGIDKSTLSKFLREPKDLLLSAAVRISNATGGQVKTDELLYEEVYNKKNNFITSRGKTYRRSGVEVSGTIKTTKKPKEKSKKGARKK